MNKFTIRTCPLCSKKLRVGDEDSFYDFFCEEFYLRGYSSIDNLFGSYAYREHAGSYYKEPHYSIAIKDGIWIQSTIIPPYWIVSSSDSDKSRIFKFDKSIKAEENNLLMEVPIIVPSDYLPEVFAKKIKNLVIFT